MLQQKQKRALFLPFTHVHSLADHIMENLKVKLFFLTCICYFLDRIHYRRTIDVVQGRLPWQTRGNTTGVAAYKSIPGSVWKGGGFLLKGNQQNFLRLLQECNYYTKFESSEVNYCTQSSRS